MNIWYCSNLIVVRIFFPSQMQSLWLDWILKFNLIIVWTINAIYYYWIQYYYNFVTFLIPFQFKQFVMHYIISLFFLLLNINWIIGAEMVKHNLFHDEIMLWIIWILLITYLLLTCWNIFHWKIISSYLISAAFYSSYLFNIRMLQFIIIIV